MFEEIEYRVYREELELEGIGRYTAFGVAGFRAGDRREPVCHVGDISTERSVAERLAELCNRNILSPSHLLDAAQDFLDSDEF
ncbi:MAG: hypothetical protein DBX66_00250 [Clostridiales bacterium]|uniref:Uncharacterized protein n=1 Tax=Harryflintia acetispora TaxID=1849041 RepID=A0A9X8UJA9_9FIRM|nr:MULTISPECIES: DUF6514 family protein [Oscillospiraceae]PWM41149.1 MAG: hypothetical protein DBX66_00250 [Clostridiales bacterium]RGB67917.1 hypothetical protein DW086_05800 [Harryflintia acetispora]TCL43440.1 hypothetical protein EDD78_10570 [Harryflintia acetispora]